MFIDYKLLTKHDNASNTRDIEATSASMHPAVEWSNAWKADMSTATAVCATTRRVSGT